MDNDQGASAHNGKLTDTQTRALVAAVAAVSEGMKVLSAQVLMLHGDLERMRGFQGDSWQASVDAMLFAGRQVENTLAKRGPINDPTAAPALAEALAVIRGFQVSNYGDDDEKAPEPPAIEPPLNAAEVAMIAGLCAIMRNRMSLMLSVCASDKVGLAPFNWPEPSDRATLAKVAEAFKAREAETDPAEIDSLLSEYSATVTRFLQGDNSARLPADAAERILASAPESLIASLLTAKITVMGATPDTPDASNLN